MKKIFGFILALLLLVGAAYAIDDIEILQSSVSLQGNPGDTVSGSFVLVNEGNTTLTSVFTGYALTFGSYQVTVSNIADRTLAAGQNTTVIFDANLVSNQFAGTYTGTLTATAGSDADSVTVNIETNEVSGLTASDIDMDAARGKSKAATLTLENTGNSDLNVQISVSDLTDGMNILSSSKITVASPVSVLFQDSEDITVTANIPATQPLGIYTGKITYTFSGETTESDITVEVREPVDDLAVNIAEIVFPKEKRNRTTEKRTFTISNTGDNTLTGIEIESTAADKYEISLSKTIVGSLAPGQETTVDVTAYIPDNEKSGIHKIGDIKVISDQDNETFALKLNVESMLEVSDIDVDYNGDSANNLEDGDSINDVKPGDTVEFNIELRNNYDEDDDVDIEDITVTITIKDIDDGDDLEEESADFDLEADSDETVKVTFEIPWDVEEKTFDVEIEIRGEDSETGQDHEEVIELKLEIDKERHSVKIIEASLDTPILACNRQTGIDVEILNIGSDEEDDVSITIENTDLGINFAQTGIELDNRAFDEDTKYMFSGTINVPSNAKPGTYPITIKSYYDNDELSDLTRIDLIVQACQTTSPEEEEEKDDTEVVIIPPKQDGTDFVPTGNDEVSIENSNRDIWLLVLANIIILVVIVVLLTYLFRKR